MDLETIRTLIEFVGRSRVSELMVSDDGVTIRVSNGSFKRHASNPAPKASLPEAANAAAPDDRGQAADGRVVVAPVFGVLHRSPEPGARPFVEVGDFVEAGQSLCIVEAMKVFNTVTAHKAGPITRILAKDGEDVEAGEPLMEIG